MKETVLITGASSGIGYQMARQLARQKMDLVLVARRIVILNALKRQLEEEHDIKVYTIEADLAHQQEAVKVYQEVKRLEIEVSAVVNNAGFGTYGMFDTQDLAMHTDMIQVNITSLVTLTYLFLQDMKEKGRGKILNMASLLAYLPFPYFTVYSATKSFVLSFTETLQAELQDTGIAVKALCPGPVDTPFSSAAMLQTRAYKSNKPVAPEKVAAAAVRHLLQGSGTKKVGFRTWFISNLPRVTPDFMMMKIKKKLASQW